MIEFVLGNVILFLLSIATVYALFKSTGDTIDKYDIPYFVLSVAIIYSLSYDPFFPVWFSGKNSQISVL